MELYQTSYKTSTRYCKTLELNEDPELVKKYKLAHAAGAEWPEITKGMKEVGILNMEIYLHKTTVFMIMDTIPDFDHEKAMAELSMKPRQSEWEAFVGQFQKTAAKNLAGEKWHVMERIYKMEE